MNNKFIIPESNLRDISLKEGISNYSIGLAIIRDNKILLVRRVPEDFMGGLYELPGGGVENNENFIQTIRREVFEETGLKMKEILGIFPGFDYLDNKKRKVRQFNFIIIPDKASIKLNPLEHDHYVWISKEDHSLIDLSPEMYKVIKAYFDL